MIGGRTSQFGLLEDIHHGQNQMKTPLTQDPQKIAEKPAQKSILIL